MQPFSAIAVSPYYSRAVLLGPKEIDLRVNGMRVPAGWQRTVVPVPPGQYVVEVFVPHRALSIGRAHTTVVVHPGQVVELEYRTPVVTWMDGSLGAPPQTHRGTPTLIMSIAFPLLLLLCLCGGLVVWIARG